MSAALVGILSGSVTLLIGLGGLVVGLRLQLYRELRNELRQAPVDVGRQHSEQGNELRQFREEGSRRHGELAARRNALDVRVDGLSTQA